jgi:LacI family transcriptional regulator
MRNINILYCSFFKSHRAHRELVRLAMEQGVHVTAVPWDETANGTFTGIFKVDAIISHLDFMRTNQLLQSRENVPHVSLHPQTAAGLSLPSVVSDHPAAGQMVAKHFLSLGFRHFACFVDTDSYVTFEQRLRGFRKTVLDAGSEEPQVVSVSSTRPDPIETLDEFENALRKMPMPLAIMAANDRAAVKVMEACRLADRSIPSQIAVCGFDNDPLTCEVAPVPLSSIDTNPEMQIREAFTMIMRILKGEPIQNQHVLISPKGVVVRRSSGLLAHAHPTIAKALLCIDQHLTSRSLDIPFILARTGGCRTNLFKAFQNELSITPLQYITQKRLEMAERLFRESNLQINEVRPKCGFASDYQMYQAFKRIYGKCPREIRNMNLSTS